MAGNAVILPYVFSVTLREMTDGGAMLTVSPEMPCLSKYPAVPISVPVIRQNPGRFPGKGIDVREGCGTMVGGNQLPPTTAHNRKVCRHEEDLH